MTKSSKNTNVAKIVKQVLDSRVEHKRLTAILGDTAITTAGTVSALSQGIGQGDDIVNRSGDVILLESVKLRVLFENSQAAYSEVRNRAILFLDTLSTGTGAVCAVTDVLETADPMSGYNEVNRQANRFKVLWDTGIVPTIGQTSKMCRYMERMIKVNKKIHYLAASGANSNGRNTLCLLIISDVANASYQYNWSQELQWTDS